MACNLGQKGYVGCLYLITAPLVRMSKLSNCLVKLNGLDWSYFVVISYAHLTPNVVCAKINILNLTCSRGTMIAAAKGYKCIQDQRVTRQLKEERSWPSYRTL